MEIKIVVHTQRVRAGESRVKRRLLNGPWRAQSKAALLLSILRRQARVSCQGYDSILPKCTEFSVKQGGTADVSIWSDRIPTISFECYD